MNTHTPAPWFNTSEDDRPTGNVGTTPLKNDVALCWGENAKVDARLISAAPDLLEACQLFLTYHDGVDKYDVAMMLAYADAEKAIRAAVAKATGGAA